MVTEEEKLTITGSKARFSDAPWYAQNTIKATPIIIGGVGGIGSWVSLFLARIGFELHLFDNDGVETVNLAGQFYSANQVGLSKVRAVSNGIDMYTDECNIKTFEQKYTKDTYSSPYMISAFDNMEARKTMFENWVEGLKETPENVYPLFIDGRMEAEFAQVYFVTPKRIEKYRKTLFDDSEVGEVNCSYKSTTHNGAMIGSVITSGLLNHIANIEYGAVFRTVPFSLHYELPLLMFTKEM